MHLRNVELFCEVVRCRSFSKAAETRDVSQPLVSQAIQALEDRLGTRLIDRSKRPFEVTPAGQEYYDACRDILHQLRAVEDRVQQMGNRITGRLRVASIYSVSFSGQEGFKRKFQNQYPEVSLQIDPYHPDEVYRLVQNDEAELGIVSFPRCGGEFGCIPWLEQEMGVVLAPNHPLAGRATLTTADLEGENLVAFTQDLKIRRQIDRWLKDSRVGVEIAQQFDNVDSIKTAVREGAGVAILPLTTVRKDVAAGQLRSARLTDVSWSRPIGIVHKRNKSLSSAAQKFVEMLQFESKADAKPETKRAAAVESSSQESSGNGVSLPHSEKHHSGNGTSRPKKSRKRAIAH
jgi:DNA-binding transcriptional LysR family regulator